MSSPPAVDWGCSTIIIRNRGSIVGTFNKYRSESGGMQSFSLTYQKVGVSGDTLVWHSQTLPEKLGGSGDPNVYIW